MLITRISETPRYSVSSLDAKKYFANVLREEHDKFINGNARPIGEKEKELAVNIQAILADAINKIESL